VTDYKYTDHNRRPLIRPKGGGGRVSHQRVTNFIKHVSDGGEGLVNWKAQRVAAGAAKRRDLVEQVAAYWPPTDENKEKLNEICEDLAKAALADEGRNRGDGWHERLRKVNLGEEPTITTDELEQMAEEYQELLKRAGLVVDTQYVERTIVLPDWKVAGSFDFLARKNGEGPLIVCDIKTGKRYAPKEAAQLACYANADSIYDWDTETHEDPPGINKRIGLIVHMPAGERASLQVVNLEAGWEAVKVAVWMRDYLKRKDLTRPAQF
jgi:hypothetical protein